MPFLIFLGSGAMLLGLAHLIWMIVTKRRSQGIANWPSVEGQVLAAAVSTLARETPEGIRRTHTPVITYAYEVAGQPHTSHRLNFLPDSSTTYADVTLARAAIAPFPTGAQVKVYYNPTNPQQSTLVKPRSSAHNVVILYGVVAMIVGAGIIMLGILLLS